MKENTGIETAAHAQGAGVRRFAMSPTIIDILNCLIKAQKIVMHA
jgi:hypothetical protein